MSWRLTSSKNSRRGEKPANDRAGNPHPWQVPPGGLDNLLEQRIEKARQKREWRVFVIQTLCFMAVVYLLLTCVIGIGVVRGDSMNPGVCNNDVCLLWRLNSHYETGDIIFFNCTGITELLTKRVIAGPGDTVELIDGQVIINNVIMNEPYVYAETYAYVEGLKYPLTLGEDEYFCLGDNRTNSMDSRDARVGVINKSDIRGKVFLQIRSGK